MNNKLFILLSILFIILFVYGCEKDKPNSLYTSDYTSNPTPVITAINPPDAALAGIVEVTIIGEHFSPIKENNFVYFGKTKAIALESSETQLIVQSPNIIQDSLQVKVAVLGAQLFSNIIYYNLLRAVGEYGGYGDYDKPYAIACDNEENLYVILGDKKVEKISPDGVREHYASTTISIPTAIKMGPGGSLFIARKTKDIYRILPGAGKAEKWVRAPGKVYDFDFAENGKIYAGGKGDGLYMIDPDDGSSVTVADYPDTYIRTVRIFDGYVYAGGLENSTNHRYIWRNQIMPDDSLGQNEIYFDWSEKIDPDSEIFSITFAQDGDLYIGTEMKEAIIIVHPDGTHEPLYPGVLQPTSYNLCWGSGQYLYVCRHQLITNESGDQVFIKQVIKINMLKYSAPYYGRQ